MAQVLTVTVKNPKALKLLKNLEELELIDIDKEKKEEALKSKLLRRLERVRNGQAVEINIEEYL